MGRRVDYGVKLAGALESSHREACSTATEARERDALGLGESLISATSASRVKGACETAAGKVTATLVHAARRQPMADAGSVQ